MRVVRRLIRDRFGAIPEWAEARLKTATHAEVEEFGSRLLTASTLEDALLYVGHMPITEDILNHA